MVMPHVSVKKMGSGLEVNLLVKVSVYIYVWVLGIGNISIISYIVILRAQDIPIVLIIWPQYLILYQELGHY